MLRVFLRPVSPFAPMFRRCRSAPAMAAFAVLAGSVFGEVGCGDSTGMLCTLAGCNSGVTVQVTPLPTGPFRVEVSPLGHPVSFVRDCEDPADCAKIFFPSFIPEAVSVRVTTASDTVFVEIVQLEYREFRPNGPRCGPVCRNADLDIPLPN